VSALKRATEAERPIVSVVVPMLNERWHIEACLDGFAAQTYPLDCLEVIVVDGGSSDGGREMVERVALSSTWVRLLDNPKRRASVAFNLGVASAVGEIVCLFSAHGVPDPNYIERSVTVLTETGAAGVGGRYLHVGQDPASAAIGLAMMSPFGMASRHRFASGRQEVDTISHPAYVRQALLDIGPFDEGLERNSDYELNYRLRSAGERLMFDDEIRSIYRPRTSLVALGRQFWWYGRWKARVVRRHPGSLRLRHVVAPAAILGAAVAPVLLIWPWGRRAAAAGGGLYGALVVAAVVLARPREHNADPMILGRAFPVMHAAWGAGFLASAIEDALRR
jgi:succinoglycan biosynthesis protein ExoA